MGVPSLVRTTPRKILAHVAESTKAGGWPVVIAGRHLVELAMHQVDGVGMVEPLPVLIACRRPVELYASQWSGPAPGRAVALDDPGRAGLVELATHQVEGVSLNPDTPPLPISRRSEEH